MNTFHGIVLILSLACISIAIPLDLDDDNTDYFNKLVDDLLTAAQKKTDLNGLDLGVDGPFQYIDTDDTPYEVTSQVYLNNLRAYGVNGIARVGNTTGQRYPSSATVNGQLLIPAPFLNGTIDFTYWKNKDNFNASWPFVGISEGDLLADFVFVISTQFNRVIVKSLNLDGEQSVDYDVSNEAGWASMASSVVENLSYESDVLNGLLNNIQQAILATN